MPAKRTPTPSAPASDTATPVPAAMPAKSSSAGSRSSSGGKDSFAAMGQRVFNYYMDTTPQRTKLIDVFMAFLVVVGAIQFLYCVLAGNYPFNAFLSGFCGTVGQFVLTASLRIQTQETNKNLFPSVSPERAFADYVVCSLILHFFCVNFIN